MSQELIDLQFDRAVEIVQSLPKTGPIQTGYEEKLAMYSLYKQATVGNVTSSRPGMWDMLARAKWDAWAKQKDLDSREAKWRYVETLMKVLRKYSDKTVARDLVQELESYGDPASVVTSASLGRARSASGSSSGSTADEPLMARPIPNLQHQYATSDEEETTDDEHPMHATTAASEVQRPHSSMSSQMRYRTPLTGSTIGGAPGLQQALGPFSPVAATPAMQPLPEYATPSAFAHSDSPLQSTSYPTSNIGYPSSSRSPQLPYGGPYAGTPTFQRNFVPGRSPQAARSPMPTSSAAHASSSSLSAANRSPLERAVESMQASLAALHERLEALERYAQTRPGNASSSSLHDSRRWSGHVSPSNRPHRREWDPSNMGLWSLLLQPLSRLQNNLQFFIAFVTDPDARAMGPVLMIVRRLLLDTSFVLFVVWMIRFAWRGTRDWRREILDVWRQVRSKRGRRVLVDRGV